MVWGGLSRCCPRPEGRLATCYSAVRHAPPPRGVRLPWLSPTPIAVGSGRINRSCGRKGAGLLFLGRGVCRAPSQNVSVNNYSGQVCSLPLVLRRGFCSGGGYLALPSLNPSSDPSVPGVGKRERNISLTNPVPLGGLGLHLKFVIVCMFIGGIGIYIYYASSSFKHTSKKQC